MAIRWKIPKPTVKTWRIGPGSYRATACVPAYESGGERKNGLICSSLKRGKTKAEAVARAKRDLVREVKSAPAWLTGPYWR